VSGHEFRTLSKLGQPQMQGAFCRQLIIEASLDMMPRVMERKGLKIDHNFVVLNLWFQLD
jgi:hypothetical protein